jgi:large subunit ribosomal protein L28
MARLCVITHKKTATGNNISHAKNRTKRLFKVNLHKHTFKIAGNQTLKLRLSAKGLRTIDKYGLQQALTLFVF